MDKHEHNHQHNRGVMIGCILLIIGVITLSRVYQEINQMWWLALIFAAHGVMIVIMAKRSLHQDEQNNKEEQ